MSIIKTEIDFMRWRKAFAIGSVLMVLVSIGSLAVNSLNFGLDFTSGTLVDVAYPETADIAAIRETLVEAGYEQAVVVPYGSDREVLVRVPSPEDVEERDASAIGDQIMSVLQADSNGEIVLRSSEFVSPKVGEELAESGGMGMLVALGIVMIYVAVRFQFKFSVAAVVALMHDVLVILGLFSLFQVTFDLTVLAALLAVIGYSLNDTIVVADRIRENFRILRSGTPAEMINISLNQVLSRTIITSFTTLLVLLAMLFVGGDAIRGFAEALIMGITVGTYSSLYVVTNVLLYMEVSKEDLMVPVKEGSDLDSMP